MITHFCHAFGCSKAVAPRLIFCVAHWRMCPAENKRSIWATYRPGQEKDKRPTDLYRANAKLAIGAVAELEGHAHEADVLRRAAAKILEKVLRQGHV